MDNMMRLNIEDETAPLRAVILGTAQSNGPTPTPQEAYDPKSLEHILAGTYPREADMVGEMEAFARVLQRHGVEVYRPEILKDVNQIFSRDIAFVIEDRLFHANILPRREDEFKAIQGVLDQLDPGKIIRPPEEVHIEGGDVIPWRDHIFVGTYTGRDYASYITARTNGLAVEYLREQFPHKTVKSFELRKSNTDPRANALHLDCCFQPIGDHMAILHKNGFLMEEEYRYLVDYFGKDRIFEIDREEMYMMSSNVFSISPQVVVSERNFVRLNTWLRNRGITVEEVPYGEIAKQEGLLRCSTLPLIRDKQ